MFTCSTRLSQKKSFSKYGFLFRYFYICKLKAYAFDVNRFLADPTRQWEGGGGGGGGGGDLTNVALTLAPGKM